jgi:nucleotide-binding universal stress UspA family protein
MTPFRTVLAAVDFSDGSRAALELAARLSVQCGATLHVVHAVEPLLAAAAVQQGRDLVAEARDELRTFSAATWPAPTCNPTLHVIAGASADTILQAAEREHADVIVVGSRGMSAVERMMFGSTTEYVLRKADVSVLVAPPQWTGPRTEATDLSGVGPFIAGVDFAASSLLAADAACWLARSLRTCVHLVHVVRAPGVIARWKPEAAAVVAEQTGEARRELTALATRLSASVAVSSAVEAGDAAEGLAAAIAPYASRSPMLVLGRRAGGRRGVAPGAVAYAVLTAASIPVLVYLPEA